jgi:hypothetical protein
MRFATLYPTTDYAYFMLDIETTGLSPFNHKMTSFSLLNFKPMINFIQYVVSLPPLTREQVDPQTIEFRKKHFINIREEYLSLKYSVVEEDIPRVIKQFLLSSCEGKTPILFVNHPQFDVPFLQKIYETHGEQFPWKHYHVFDLDSIFVCNNINKKIFTNSFQQTEDFIDYLKEVTGATTFTPHDSLHDCTWQAWMLEHCL